MTLKNTRKYSDVKVGEELPALDIPITTTLIAGGAIATRDYYPGHHDRSAARSLGSPDIFMNILTTNALVQRFVENWTGPLAVINAVRIKLGTPNYPGDTMVLSGEVSSCNDHKVEITLKGKNSLGNHVTGTVTVALP